eukprot:2964419-Rhodomonas_salina.3
MPNPRIARLASRNPTPESRISGSGVAWLALAPDESIVCRAQRGGRCREGLAQATARDLPLGRAAPARALPAAAIVRQRTIGNVNFQV